MPAGSGSKASYEDWASKMSGLLETTGVRGFLETPIERRPEDAEADEARELILAMWEAQRGKSNPSDRRFDEDEGWRNSVDWSKPVKASDIAQLVVAGAVSLDFGFKDPARAVGELMRQQMDVPLAFETETGKTITLTVRKSRYQGTTRWHVEKETAE